MRKSYLDGWRAYPLCAAGHHVQGALAGIGLCLPQFMPLAATWTALYVCYQALTWLRKKDTAGLDVTDYQVGMGVGFLVYLASQLVV